MFVLGRTTRTLQREPNLTEALTRAFMFADASVANEIHVVEVHVTRMLMAAMRNARDAETLQPTEEELAITKVIGDVWLASLVQWVTGRASAHDVGAVPRRRGPACCAALTAPADSLTPCRPTPPRSSTSRCLSTVSVWLGDRAATRRTRTAPTACTTPPAR